MDLLIQWVTQIIVFLLLAAVIDLLIPANAMKKYIRLVVGLVLILIFLKPVFFLFNIDIHQALETSFSQLNKEELKNESVENLIKMQKSEIDDTQDAYILEQMAVQLKDIAKGPLAEKFQVEIVNIEFLFTTKNNYTFKDLEEVIVYLQESDGGEGAVNAIDEVVINTDDPEVHEERQDDEQIKSLLSEIWELGDKKLTVNWEGGAS
jgi:stage III sporulation protein AF